jgi:hypothetical protein
MKAAIVKPIITCPSGFDKHGGKRMLKKSIENSGKMNGYGRMGDKNCWRYVDGWAAPQGDRKGLVLGGFPL